MFQRTERVWACSGNPLRLVTSLSAFLFCGNRQRHTGYQETELTSGWWAADVQGFCTGQHPCRPQTAMQVMTLIVTTGRLQLFISLSLNSSLPGIEKVWSWAQLQGLIGYLENHVKEKVGAGVLTEGEDVCAAYGPNLGQEGRLLLSLRAGFQMFHFVNF